MGEEVRRFFAPLGKAKKLNEESSNKAGNGEEAQDRCASCGMEIAPGREGAQVARRSDEGGDKDAQVRCASRRGFVYLPDREMGIHLSNSTGGV